MIRRTVSADTDHNNMNTFTINCILGGFSSLALGIMIFLAYRKKTVFTPTTKIDLLRRSAVRLGIVSVPYLVMAWLCLHYGGDGEFLHGWWFWFAVVVIPGVGLALDLCRVQRDPKH